MPVTTSLLIYPSAQIFVLNAKNYFFMRVRKRRTRYSAKKPGGRPGTVLTRFMADKLLKSACFRLGLVGVSTHSFRRTALTQMANAGIPLRHIQEISGHNDLGTLQRYLEVTLLATTIGCGGDWFLAPLENYEASYPCLWNSLYTAQCAPCRSSCFGGTA